MPYDIDDGCSFDDNLSAFLISLEASDAKLAAALQDKLPDLLRGRVSIADVWNALEVAAREPAQ